MSHLKIYTLIVCLALTLAACSGSAANEPEMIASFPEQGSGSAPQPINPPPAGQFVYDASLELDVSNLDRTADRAVDLAYQYDGYLVSSHAWQSGDTQHATLVLAVPAANFDVAFNALSRLGEVVNQHINGEWVSRGTGDGWSIYSQITVRLNDQQPTWSHVTSDWRPLRTLQSAWDVFTAIFGFLGDLIIWLLVVVGPFLVLAYVLHRVVKRVWRNPQTKQPPE
jgi:hypothetical protein